jgi:NAD(P)-dependent dehydrogenase (short-subunit alcohol dehydrogenase family)
MSKVIAVIGAGPGVGLAVAQRFGREGFNVALVSRNADKLAGLVKQLNDEGITASAHPADVSDEPGLAAALASIMSHYGHIDVLEFGPTARPDTLRSARNTDVENEKFHLNIAVLGAITAVRAVLPSFLERKSGTLLFTTASSAKHPTNLSASFGVAAGAALNYARVLNEDLKPEGIHAGIVCIAALVSRPDNPIPEGLGYPVVSSAQVAEAHWEHYVERADCEKFVGEVGGRGSLSLEDLAKA